MPSRRLIILIFFLILFKTLFVYSQTSENLEKFLELKKMGTSNQEEILKEIRKAFSLRDYERVIREFERLSFFLRIPAEDLFLLSKAYFYTGNPEKSIDFAERVQSLRRGTSLYCEAGILKAKALLILDKKKEVEKVLKELETTFCKEEFHEKIKLLEIIWKNKFFEEEITSKILKEFLREIYEAKFNYLISKGRLKEAEKIAFEFINLTGEYREGKNFFFKLAEAYFKLRNINEAKKYYQLIITEWDLTKEASISKFRLYQITYERAALKELLPPKTIEDLLMFITQIKTKYAEEKGLVEEASFLEIKVNFDRKNLERTRDLSKEFLRKYPQSNFVEEVKKMYCNASVFIVPQYFLSGKLKDLREIAEKEEEYFKESNCGDFYYSLGKEIFKYRLYGLSLDYFLTAYEYKISKENMRDLYVKLAYLADLYGEREIFNLLWEKLNKELGKEFTNMPLFLYLKAKVLIEKDLQEALLILKKIPDDKDFSFLKKELYYRAYLKALEKKRYSIAYEILKDFPLGADSKEYILILSDTVDRAPEVFERILKEAKEKFPENPQIKFLEAYYLSKKGDLKKTKEITEFLVNKGGYLSLLAKEQQKIQELTKRIQDIVY